MNERDLPKPIKKKRVRFTARAKSKLKTRLVRSVPEDFARWDAAASRLGLSPSEFARRALNAYAERS
jgi:hypothetical protein